MRPTLADSEEKIGIVPGTELADVWRGLLEAVVVNANGSGSGPVTGNGNAIG